MSPARDNASEIWDGPNLNQYTGTGLVVCSQLFVPPSLLCLIKLQLTVVYPCYDRSQSPPVLIGVVGVDLPIEQIDALARNFVVLFYLLVPTPRMSHNTSQAAPSYSFIVNNAGEALVHPLIPTGANYKSIPSAIDITELENLRDDTNFSGVRDQLMRGAKGTTSIKKVVRQLRGYDHFEGYTYWNATAHYYFRPLSRQGIDARKRDEGSRLTFYFFFILFLYI